MKYFLDTEFLEGTQKNFLRKNKTYYRLDFNRVGL